VKDENAVQRVARLEKAVSRCLELLESGAIDEVRLELMALVSRSAPAVEALPVGTEFSDPMSDNELDRAFADAESQTDDMVSADTVAKIAMDQADRSLAGQLGPDELGSSFATESMAELLEQQGNLEAARRIRVGLAQAAAANDAASTPAEAPSFDEKIPSRQRTLVTLERWLGNLRGSRA
jgi:hypothetical protein